MKKNLFIFAVSIISVLGVYSGARANVASADYVTEQLKGKLDNANGVIEEKHLIKALKDKIDGALTKISATTTIDDRAIGFAKLNGGANANKVLTVVDANGNVSPQFVSIPVGQTGTGGAATIWIEQ